MAALSGIRVIDLTRLLPGPYGTMLLADQGADVIKIEEPKGGDPIRQMKEDIDGIGQIFAQINRGKRSLTLNLRSDVGKDLFRNLLERADVLVEGFRPGVMQRLGLDFETLTPRYPKLIYCSISGFGQSGPNKLLPGHDLNYLGYAGVLHQATTAEPVLPPTLLADLHAGQCAALGVVLALQERERTGKGKHVDVDMTRALAPFLLPWLGIADQSSEPVGTAWFSGALACYNVYRTADGKAITLAALEEKFWREFCKVAERPDLADGHLDPQRQTGLRQQIAEVIAAKPQQHWLELAQTHDICIGPVRTHAETLDDPSVRDEGWPNPFPSAVETSKSPELGADTGRILVEELGQTPQQVERLRAQGIV